MSRGRRAKIDGLLSRSLGRLEAQVVSHPLVDAQKGDFTYRAWLLSPFHHRVESKRGSIARVLPFVVDRLDRPRLRRAADLNADGRRSSGIAWVLPRGLIGSETMGEGRSSRSISHAEDYADIELLASGPQATLPAELRLCLSDEQIVLLRDCYGTAIAHKLPTQNADPAFLGIGVLTVDSPAERPMTEDEVRVVGRLLRRSAKKLGPRVAEYGRFRLET